MVEVSKPEKVLFPEIGATKADLARHYELVGGRMLPHVEGRPVSMERFPDGVEREGFFHKDPLRRRPASRPPPRRAPR